MVFDVWEDHELLNARFARVLPFILMATLDEGEGKRVPVLRYSLLSENVHRCVNNTVDVDICPHLERSHGGGDVRVRVRCSAARATFRYYCCELLCDGNSSISTVLRKSASCVTTWNIAAV